MEDSVHNSFDDSNDKLPLGHVLQESINQTMIEIKEEEIVKKNDVAAQVLIVDDEMMNILVLN